MKREVEIKTNELQQSRISFVELARKNYDEHTRPLKEEINKTEQVIRELHEQYGKADNEMTRKAINKLISELYDILPKMNQEYNIISSTYKTDTNLEYIARELDSIEGHNATVDVYYEIDQKIREHIVPLTNKLIQMYGSVNKAPLIVFEIGKVQKTSKSIRKKDRIELEKQFFDLYNKIENERNKEKELENKYRNILEDILKKHAKLS